MLTPQNNLHPVIQVLSFYLFFEAGLKVLTKLFDGSGIIISDITKTAKILITDFDVP